MLEYDAVEFYELGTSHRGDWELVSYAFGERGSTGCGAEAER